MWWFNLLSVRGDTPICSPDLIIALFTITGLIVETTLKFINDTRYKVFGYRVFVMERIWKLWHLKTISSLQLFKTPFNARCSLVLVCKDIIPKYERTKSKYFFSTVGMFSLTRWILFKNFWKHLSVKFSG